MKTKERVIVAFKGDVKRILETASFLARREVGNFFVAVGIIAERVEQGEFQVENGF